jgi:tetratricopeptide (TPR) repeat protein
LLGQQYFENKKFQDYFVSHFVMFRANRTQKVGEDIFKKFNIMGTPTVMILDPDGSEVDWHVGYGPPPEKFHESIDKSYRGIETFKFYTAQYGKDPKNLDVIFHLAGKYGDRYNQDKATTLYNEVLAIDPEGKKGTTDYAGTAIPYTQAAEYEIASLSLYGSKGGPGGYTSFIRKYKEGELVQLAATRLAFFWSRSSPNDSVTQFYEDVIRKYPDLVQVLGAYVDYINNGKQNVDRGIAVAGKIMEMMKHREDPRFVGALAKLYILKADTAKADSVYGKQFIDDEVSSLSYNLIAYANFWAAQKMNSESAVAMAEMSLKLNPDNLYLLRQAAGVCSKLNKLDRALELFGPSYVEKNGGDANKLYTYANFWSGEEKNLESALAAAKKAVELSPATPYYWGTLAGVHHKMKHDDEAITAGEKAVALADENQKAYYKNKLDAIKKSDQKGPGGIKEGK